MYSAVRPSNDTLHTIAEKYHGNSGCQPIQWQNSSNIGTFTRSTVNQIINYFIGETIIKKLHQTAQHYIVLKLMECW